MNVEVDQALERHRRTGATARRLARADHDVGGESADGGGRNDHVHHRTGIAGGRADLDPPRPHGRHRLGHAGDDVGELRRHPHLRGQKTVVKRVHVGVGRFRPVFGGPRLEDRRHVEDGLDVRPLGHAHRRAGLGDGDRRLESLKRRHEGGGGGRDSRGRPSFRPNRKSPPEGGRCSDANRRGSCLSPSRAAGGDAQFPHRRAYGGERARHLVRSERADAADAEALGQGQFARI